MSAGTKLREYKRKRDFTRTQEPSGATSASGKGYRFVVQKHDANAQRPFAAYGVTPNGDDPLSKALHGLISHAVQQEQQIERILAVLKAAGLPCQGVAECDKLNSDQLNKLVD